MLLRDTAELYKGLSNIPISLIAFFFGLKLMKRTSAHTEGCRVFMLSAGASVMGVILHCFRIKSPVFEILWIILYILLFEDARLFTELILKTAGEDKPFCGFKSLIPEIVLLLASAIWVLFDPEGDIIPLTVFAFICIIRIAAGFIKNRTLPRPVLIMLCVLLAAILALALKNILPGAIVICHFLLAAVLYLLYCIAAAAEG